MIHRRTCTKSWKPPWAFVYIKQRLYSAPASPLSATSRNHRIASASSNKERETGFEPATSSLGSWHSTAELLPLILDTLHIINTLIPRCQSRLWCGLTLGYVIKVKNLVIQMAPMGSPVSRLEFRRRDVDFVSGSGGHSVRRSIQSKSDP